MSGKKLTRRGHRAGYLLIFLLVAAILACLFATVNIAAALWDYAAAAREYESLRRHFPDVIIASPSARSEKTAAPTETPKPSAMPIPETDAPPVNKPQPASNLSAVNPDYTGWIKIEGTDIDYPVVRGKDNDTYLTTTFSGTNNPSGAIFMDYRCSEGFDSPAVIIYGHNMNDGSMFAQLARYLEPDFLEQNPFVTIIKPGGEIMSYTIFAARVTDTSDSAYTLPQDETGILILSTCTNNRNYDERLIVLAEELRTD